MSVSLITASAPEQSLTADRLGELLAASGYRCAMSVLRGSHVLPAGFSLALQFGDQTSRDAEGVERPTIKASIVLSGSDRRAGETTTRWQLGKFVPAFIGNTASGFAVEADVLLGAAVDIEEVLIRGGELMRHLRLLIQDARATLGALPVDSRLNAKANGPVMRIEARLAGGIVAGRSGVVRQAAGAGASTRTAMPHILSGIAVCNCLDDQILPELARATRAAIAQARSPGSALAKGHPRSWLQKQQLNPAETVSEILQ